MFFLVFIVVGDFIFDNDVIYNFFFMLKKNWFMSSVSIVLFLIKIYFCEEENKCIYIKIVRFIIKEYLFRCFKYFGYYILFVEVDLR